MNDMFLRELRALLGDAAVKTEESMALHTTFRIGGPARVYAAPADTMELARAAALCREYGEPYCLIGRGSNLLVSDHGVDGVVLSTERMDQASVLGTRVRAHAGISLAKLARLALDASLTGLEFAAGIPGTLGGAVVMNAGAYGGEMKDVLADVTVLAPDGTVRLLPAEELGLGYRTSRIPSNGWIVLEAELELKKGDPEAVRARMDDLAVQRKAKQPLEYPSAGSMFKRPAGYYAGKLIDDAGLRGFQVGGAQVSEKHCGFVVNRGGATAEDVLSLCEEVSRIVYEKFGVKLEREVKYLDRI